MITPQRYALVSNINTDRHLRADYDIHAADCTDLRKVEPGSIEYVEADSAADVVAYSTEALSYDLGDEAAKTFEHHILPCCKPKGQS